MPKELEFGAMFRDVFLFNPLQILNAIWKANWDGVNGLIFSINLDKYPGMRNPFTFDCALITANREPNFASNLAQSIRVPTFE